MRILVIVATLFLTVSAFGHGNQAHSTLGNDNNINNCNPTVVCKPKVIYMTHKQAKRIKDLEAQVAALKAELAAKDVEQEVIEIVETIEVQAEKKLNSVSLIVPYTPTDLKVTKSATTFEAESVHEWDLGLMYQRADFLAEDLRGSLGITMQGTIFGGLGLDF